MPSHSDRIWRGFRSLSILLLLTAAAIAISGYHYCIEDEAIYLPAIKKHVNPALYPHDSIFFVPQTRPTVFDDLVAWTARAFHAQVASTVFFYYVLTLFLFLAAAWTLARSALPSWRARWGGAALVASSLTLPVAGVAIYIADQHLHPRTLASALILFAAASVLPSRDGRGPSSMRYLLAASLWAGAVFIHIQMAFYGAIFLCFLVVPWPLTQVRGKAQQFAAFVSIPLATLFEKGSPEWQEASRTRVQHYLLRWHWYEWLGAIAPVFVLWLIARIARNKGLAVTSFLAARTALYTAFGVIAACVLTLPPQLERLTPYQPMRTLHLSYVGMILLGGGLLAEYVLQRKLWRWAALFLPIVGVMCFAQGEQFPGTRHIEWPGRPTSNDWIEAFDWVKANTPVDAYFAMDPRYMSAPGEDYHGFRGLAERGQMADWDKDPGVALLFPELAQRWHREVHALDNWRSFTRADFLRLQREFGVNWVVLSAPRGSENGPALPAEFDCPYSNRSVYVCRVR